MLKRVRPDAARESGHGQPLLLPLHHADWGQMPLYCSGPDIHIITIFRTVVSDFESMAALKT